MTSSSRLSLRLPHSADERDRTVPSFPAIEIRCMESCCQAAAEARGRRYLCTDAPLLPLKQCDRPDRCECRYRHHDDRRRGPRRGDEAGTPPQSHANQAEQRTTAGRRSQDREVESDPTSPLDDTYYDYIAKTKPDSHS